MKERRERDRPSFDSVVVDLVSIATQDNTASKRRRSERTRGRSFTKKERRRKGEGKTKTTEATQRDAEMRGRTEGNGDRMHQGREREPAVPEPMKGQLILLRDWVKSENFWVRKPVVGFLAKARANRSGLTDWMKSRAVFLLVRCRNFDIGSVVRAKSRLEIKYVPRISPFQSFALPEEEQRGGANIFRLE
jgi:hypothetical protein